MDGHTPERLHAALLRGDLRGPDILGLARAHRRNIVHTGLHYGGRAAARDVRGRALHARARQISPDNMHDSLRDSGRHTSGQRAVALRGSARALLEPHRDARAHLLRRNPPLYVPGDKEQPRRCSARTSSTRFSG